MPFLKCLDINGFHKGPNESFETLQAEFINETLILIIIFELCLWLTEKEPGPSCSVNEMTIGENCIYYRIRGRAGRAQF